MSNDDELMPWAEIAKRVGMSRSGVRKAYARALDKLRIALICHNIDEDWLREYYHLRERAEALSQDNLSALLPPPVLAHDGDDPDTHTKLRRL